MTKTKLKGLLSPFLKRLRLKEVAKYIKKNQTILDAGCDDASLLTFIKNIKYYTGVDFNKRIVEQNKKRFKKFKNIEFLNRDLNKNLKLSKKYDLIVLSAVIEHLNNFKKFLSNMEKITHKDSLIIITTPIKKSDSILKIGARFRIFSKESLNEHQKYFLYNDFMNLRDWKLKLYRTFELGLNQLVILERK